MAAIKEKPLSDSRKLAIHRRLRRLEKLSAEYQKIWNAWYDEWLELDDVLDKFPAPTGELLVRYMRMYREHGPPEGIPEFVERILYPNGVDASINSCDAAGEWLKVNDLALATKAGDL